MQENLARTPLFQNHLNLKGRMVPFAGYEMPVQYTGVLDEAKACRKSIGLFDVSHMGQLRLQGKNTLQALQKLVTNDLSLIRLGQAQYNLLCNESGGVIDDIIVYRRSEDDTYICVNASNRKVDWEWMKERLPSTLSFTDESDDTGLIAVQGPHAEALISSLSSNEVKDLKYYWAQDLTLAGKPVYLSRTGYTGEDGFEIYCKANDASYLWQTLLEKGKTYEITPCGLGARDTLRLEMGYPLHGHELSPTISPLMAGLNWVVKLQQPSDFIGKTALIKEAASGPKKLLKAFVVQDKRIARLGYPICNTEGETVGEITSGTQSPHLGAPIAMGFVDSRFANSSLAVDVRGTKLPLTTTKLPFVPSRVKKNPPANPVTAH